MLAKCTNPSCSVEFRYLHEGKLFRLEVQPLLNSCRARTVEYFWLCSPCSEEMTLRLAQNGQVMAIPLHQATQEEARVLFTSLNQKGRRFLRSITFLRSGASGEPHENAA
jgi:hypothetical protein